MGLDVYFHKVKKVRKSKNDDLLSVEEYSKINDNRVREAFKKFAENSLKKLEKAKDDASLYGETYRKVFKGMKKFTVYDFLYKNMLEETKSVEDVKKFFDGFLIHLYAESDAYFRKVNFVYRYFMPKLEDECCIVTREDIEELISRCDKVLNDNSLAEDLLPTQSGFFFGSTEYDNWYYSDVRDVKRQMTKLLRGYDEDTDVIYVMMSW